MNTKARSLHQFHRWRYDVPLAVLGTLAIFILALFMKVMYVRKIIYTDKSYSIIEGVAELWEKHHIILAVVLFLFSIVFPLIKLLALLGVWFIPMTHKLRRRSLHLLGLLGKWSMMDVFVVALVIVVCQANLLIKASPRTGIYVFGVAIILSVLATIYIEHLARQMPE